MIKNERQYRISRSQRDKFADQLKRFGDYKRDAMLALHHAAHQSQIETLNAEILEYEELIGGQVSVFAVNSLSELPLSLIRARIARRKTQKDLATLLGVKEQQVQRWEAEGYEGASLGTLKEIATALDVHISSDLVVLDAATDISLLMKKLSVWGFSKHMLERMLPPASYSALATSVTSGELWNALMELSAVFGVTMRRLFDPTMLNPLMTGSGVRYKMTASADSRKVDAFTVYAHYVAALACTACSQAVARNMPSKPDAFRSAVLRLNARLNLDSILNFAWSHGVIILPLCYEGAFHGAVWKIGGKYVIVVKQTTEQTARWLFDLLHEIGHIVNDHVTEMSAVIETEPLGPKESDVDDEETVANEWAEDVLFDGRTEEIERAVVRECRGNLRMLKNAVSKVADTENMELGVLANHMAWRLSKESTSWWGTAENMQKSTDSPASIVRKYLSRHMNLALLNDLDREMFVRAISET